MIPVDIAPEVHAALRQMRDRGAQAPGVVKPAGVELTYSSEDLGQGETESRHGYYWTQGDRSILAEEIKNEIFDGATPYSTYVRGVIIDGDRSVLLSGKDDRATVIEG